MRIPLSVLCGLALGTGPWTTAVGQTHAAPTLVFTIHGGVAVGHALWSVAQQPICNTSNGTCQGTSYDTVRIARGIGDGIAAGLSFVFFPADYVGFYGDISFVGLTLEDACEGLYYSGGTGSLHDLQCQNIAEQSITMGGVAFSGGISVRAVPHGSLSPYLQLGVGMFTFSQSTLDMSGAAISSTGTVQTLPVVVDLDPTRSSPLLTIGGGLRAQLGPAYGLRFDVKDLIARFERLDGSVNALGSGPTSTRYYHHPVFSIGFDVVLERKRGRRY